MTDPAAERQQLIARTLARAVELHAGGDFQSAAALYHALLSIAPDHPDLLQLYGALCAQIGDPAHAVVLMRRSLELSPRQPAVLVNLGNALRAAGHPDQALPCFDGALEIEPAQPATLLERSRTLLELRRLPEALASADEALSVQPGAGDALHQRAAVLLQMHRFGEAGDTFGQIVAREPANVDALLGLAISAHERGDTAQARACSAQALAIAPSRLAARLTQLHCRLPALADSAAELAPTRASFAQGVAELAAWLDGATGVDPAPVSGLIPTFYLAYRDGDNTADLARLGTAWCRCLARWQAACGIAVPVGPRAGQAGRRRIGIVSAHVREHSVHDVITKTFLRACRQADCEVSIFMPSRHTDAETSYAAAGAQVFEHGHRPLAAWAALIAQAQCDVLVYPEIGMDETTFKLASLRLAPLQLASWGHPSTTGLATIDAYVSAQALEPPGADAHYSERLIRLPGLGCHLTRSTLLATGSTFVPPHLPSLGLDGDLPLFICPGTPFKYSPAHDELLARIAERVGPCQFAFFEFQERAELSRRLLERVGRAFSARGLEWTSYLRLVPHLPKATFRLLCGQATAVLDTAVFSGFNTAVHVLESGAPYVAWEGAYLRGRLASGTLRYLGLDELVAGDAERFVELATRLAQDTAYADAVRARIEHGRAALYGDEAVVVALADLLSGTA